MIGFNPFGGGEGVGNAPSQEIEKKIAKQPGSESTTESSVPGTDLYADTGLRERLGPGYELGLPTPAEQREANANTAAIAKSTKKNEEALADIRQEIKEMKPVEHAETQPTTIFDELKDVA